MVEKEKKKKDKPEQSTGRFGIYYGNGAKIKPKTFEQRLRTAHNITGQGPALPSDESPFLREIRKNLQP